MVSVIGWNRPNLCVFESFHYLLSINFDSTNSNFESESTFPFPIVNIFRSFEI